MDVQNLKPAASSPQGDPVSPAQPVAQRHPKVFAILTWVTLSVGIFFVLLVDTSCALLRMPAEQNRPPVQKTDPPPSEPRAPAKVKS